MANVLGLSGFSPSSGNNSLIAAYGNGFVNVVTGIGYGIPITPDINVEFETFLDSLFYQNYMDTPLTFDGTVWSREHVSKLPLSKYLKRWNERMYLGYIKIGSEEFPSRIWYSDLPVNNTIQWGYEQGTNLRTIAGNTLVSAPNAGFKTFNIKRGDPIFILTGNDIGQYTVEQIPTDQQLILTEPLKNTATGITYWVGGNFFDISRDDGDFITWISENNNELTVFKRDSLHRYDGTRRGRVKDAYGTTSGRSVVNLHELSIYFHGASGLETGFYAYDGRESVKISGSLDKHIDGIAGNMYTTITAWREGELYRAYVGDINNTNYNISVAKAVLTWDYTNNNWSVDPISDVIKASSEFRQSGVKQVYVGTDDDEVHVTPSGFSQNGSPVPFVCTLKTLYPNGTESLNTFPRVEVLSDDAKGMRVQYKLHLKPYTTDENFNALGQLDNEKTILYLPEQNNQASGIELQFIGIHPYEPTELLKKVTIFHKKENKILY